MVRRVVWSSSEQNYLDYDGQTSQIYGIWTINLLLKIITLGIYSFWGKTRMRRYIVSSFILDDDRFTYSGTGKQLFIGFLRALPVIIVLYLPFLLWPPHTHPLTKLVFLPILFCIHAASYSALRYRYSHIAWRGIHAHLSGSPWQYAGLGMRRMFVNIFTLGIMIPFSDAKKQAYIVNHSHFGSVQAQFTPRPSSLMWSHISTMLLIIPTFGMSRFWYKAARNRHFAESTHIQNLQLQSTQTGGDLLGLVFVNILIMLFTIGLSMPVIIQRSMRFLSDTLTITGDLKSFSAEQHQAVAMKSGEGMDAMLGEHDFGFM